MHTTLDTPRDHYAVLGLARDATTAEVQRAYLHLARKHHPDLQLAAEREAALLRFAAIAEARRVLSDPRLRQRYDDLDAPPPKALSGADARRLAAARETARR